MGQERRNLLIPTFISETHNGDRMDQHQFIKISIIMAAFPTSYFGFAALVSAVTPMFAYIEYFNVYLLIIQEFRIKYLSSAGSS